MLANCRLKELEENMHSMNVKLIVIDSIASLFLKVKDGSRYLVRKYITEISRLVLVVL